MKIKDLLYYVICDIISPRTLVEVSIGTIAVAVATAAVLLVLAFTNTTHLFIDDCFQRARPVIGVLVLTPQSEGLITLSEKKWLEEFCRQHQESIERISWISTLHNLQVYRNEEEELDWEPSIIAVPNDSAMIDPHYGLRLLRGHGFVACGDLNLQVLMNTSYLEEYLEFSEEDLKKITEHKDFSAVPKHLWVHFPPIAAKPSQFEPGTLKIPVSGLFDLKEVYPHLIFSFDAAGAYFYMNLQKWHPSYVLQFKIPRADGQGFEPLIAPQRLKGYQIARKDRLELPERSRLLRFEVLSQCQKTPYSHAWLWLTNYRQKGVRSLLKQEIEQGIVSFGLNLSELADEHTILASLRHKLKQDHQDLSDNVRVKVLEAGVRWLVQDVTSGQQYVVRQRTNGLEAYATHQWHVKIPSDLVSQALNRVTTIVNAYSSGIIGVIFLLSSFSITLFGFGYVYRKKKDIGILKSCGMSEITVGTIFISQVIFVSVCGFIVGLALAGVLSFPLESKAREIITHLHPDYLFNREVLSLQLVVILKAFGCILFASILGGIAPSWKATKVHPIKDLSMGV